MLDHNGSTTTPMYRAEASNWYMSTMVRVLFRLCTETDPKQGVLNTSLIATQSERMHNVGLQSWTICRSTASGKEPVISHNAWEPYDQLHALAV